MTINPDKLQADLEKACLMLSLWFAACFLFIALSSLSYPFPLEWMEGYIIDIVQRVANGEAVYTEPSIEYVPLIYTPYYYYVTALVANIIGVGFPAGRLVSLLSALGCAGVLYAWIRREGGNWKHGGISAGLFLASYKLSGRWFDISRSDSLSLLLILAGFYLLFHCTGKRNTLYTAALMALAFFTKQTTALYAAPVLFAWLWVDRRQALRTGGWLAVLLMVGITFFNVRSNHWFSYYVFEVPGGHNIAKIMFSRFLIDEMIIPLFLLLLLTGMMLASLRKGNRKKFIAYAALAIAVIFGCYAARLHNGSYLNVLMPAHALLALLGGLALKQYAHSRFALMVPLWVAIQLGILVYNPVRMLPPADASEKYSRFIEELAAIDGDIFMPELQFVQTGAGKKSYSFAMGAYDLLRAKLPERTGITKRLFAELNQSIRGQKFAALLPGQIFPLPEKRDLYVFERNIDYPDVYVTGSVRSIPTELYVRVQPRSE